MSTKSITFVMLLIAAAATSGCVQGDVDPCSELCDGIVRCRQGNERCVAEGMTARDPFMEHCTAQCEESRDGLDTDQIVDIHECLDCLRAETDFDSCNGEVLLDEVCAAQCRTSAAGAFRNTFGPALWSEVSCLRR